MGSLNLSTNLNSSGFNAGIAKINGILNDFGKKVATDNAALGMFSNVLTKLGDKGGILGRAMLGAGIAIGAIAGVIGKAISEASRYTEEIDKLAKANHVAVKEVMALNDALRKGGAPEGAPGAALTASSGLKEELLQGNTSKVAALKELGISRTDAVLTDSAALVIKLGKAYDESTDKVKAYLAIVRLVGEETAVNIQQSSGALSKAKAVNSSMLDVTAMKEFKIYWKGFWEELGTDLAVGVQALSPWGMKRLLNETEKNQKKETVRLKAEKERVLQEADKEHIVKTLRKSTDAVAASSGLVGGQVGTKAEVEDYLQTQLAKAKSLNEQMKALAAGRGRAVSDEEKKGLTAFVDTIAQKHAEMKALRQEAANIDPTRYLTAAEKAAKMEGMKPISDSLSKIGLNVGGGNIGKDIAETNRNIRMLQLQELIAARLLDISKGDKITQAKREIENKQGLAL